MTIEDLRSLCKSFKGVSEDIKWGHDLCFSIGDKMFLVTGMGETPQSASFKVSDEEFEELSEQPGFMPAPYLARHKWVKVDDITKISKKQWKIYAEQSYRLIASKLPVKTRHNLGIKF